MIQTKRYQYLITTTKPVFPRHIGEYFYDPKVLVSVTDLQDDSHAYGNTWHAGVPVFEQLKQSLRKIQVI